MLTKQPFVINGFTKANYYLIDKNKTLIKVIMYPFVNGSVVKPELKESLWIRTLSWSAANLSRAENHCSFVPMRIRATPNLQTLITIQGVPYLPLPPPPPPLSLFE